MNNWQKHAIAASTVLIFALQLGQTLLNTNHWPFSSYNMYNFKPTPNSFSLNATLWDNDCNADTVRIARVIPVEFFRANSIASSVFEGANEQRKEQLAKLILTRLNSAPWPSFDERESSPRPRAGGKFIAIAVEVSHDADGMTPFSQRGGEVIFKYLPDVLPQCAEEELH